MQVWTLRTDVSWRDLPPSDGDWKNTPRRFCRRRNRGVRERLLEEWTDHPEFELLMIDAGHLSVIRMGVELAAAIKTWRKSGIGPWLRMACRPES